MHRLVGTIKPWLIQGYSNNTSNSKRRKSRKTTSTTCKLNWGSSRWIRSSTAPWIGKRSSSSRSLSKAWSSQRGRWRAWEGRERLSWPTIFTIRAWTYLLKCWSDTQASHQRSSHRPSSIGKAAIRSRSSSLRVRLFLTLNTQHNLYHRFLEKA